jgi:hypothetical protein
MVRDHLVEPESRRLGLGPLMVQRLVGSANATIQDGPHRGVVSSRLLSTFANVHRAISTLADCSYGLLTVSS